MSKNRRAQAVFFGFDFQVNAAIVLMLENIQELNSLKLEGNYEDIELELNTGEYILAQAKSVEKSSVDFQNVRNNLKKALVSLSESAHKANARQLIFITNSPNPLNEDESKNLFLGDAHRDFSSLPGSSQELINGYLSSIADPIDTSKFMIQILPFETDNDKERYKVVKQVVDDFVGDLKISIPGLGNQLLTLWQNSVFQNGSKRRATIRLSKKDLMWPILVIATDVTRCNDDFALQFDSAVYDEITNQYYELIDTCCERYEFFVKVLSDYNEFQSTKPQSAKCVEFALHNWEDYVQELKLDNADEETQKHLVQIVLYNIVKNRLTIEKVRRGVNL